MVNYNRGLVKVILNKISVGEESVSVPEERKLAEKRCRSIEELMKMF